jgi:hypothetical protein
MKPVYGISLAFILVLAAAVTFTAAKQGNAQTSEGQEEQQNLGSDAKKLVGTWRVQVTIRDCATGVEIRTFRSLLTFAHGGTTAETTSSTSPLLRGPGHGIWQRTGDHTFSNQFEAFTFNSAGAWTGTQKIMQHIEIGPDPDEYSSSGSNQIVDINGNVLVTGCNTAIGRRFQ